MITLFAQQKGVMSMHVKKTEFMIGMNDSQFDEIRKCNNKSIIIGNFDVSDLEKITGVFAHGEGHIPEIQNLPLKWIAVKERQLWTIVFSDDRFTWDSILRFGEKLRTEENIRLLVPCTDAAFEKYSYINPRSL